MFVVLWSLAADLSRTALAVRCGLVEEQLCYLSVVYAKRDSSCRFAQPRLISESWYLEGLDKAPIASLP